MASKRRLRRRGCENKRVYPTEAQAIAAAGRMMARLKGYPMRCYKCHFANHWHIGTPPQRVLQGIAARRGA